MRFLEDGPNIPNHLLEQQRQGNVIFFCGAGVSMPAGLKDFRGLTKAIIDSLNAERARQAFENNEGYDRVFNLLGREFGRPQIDQKIYETLRTPRKPNLDCHESILKLSRGSHGLPQIVTTNFDLLFERVDRKISRIVPPALPDLELQPQFNGIVYLHGRLTKPERHIAGSYIISSSDFGRAYLSQGWAGRFVKALRERYTLVFLGYRAEDPPMRYLLEGLNTRGEDAYDSPIYAFVPGDAGDAEEEWHDRGVKPICYKESADHASLWTTLAAWADAASEPVSWNDRVIALAQQNPSDLKAFERGQVAQLVTTKQGAKLFADAVPKPPAEWMCVFDNYVRYAKPRSSSWEDSEEVDPLNIFGLDDDPQRPDPQPNGQRELVGANLLSWRQGDAAYSERTSLIGGGPGAVDHLPERLFHLARWFASVSSQPAAIWWATGWRALNSNLLWHVRRNFEDRDASYPEPAARFWSLYFEFQSRARPDGMDFDWYEFKKLIGSEGWGNASIRAFERLIEPSVEFERHHYGAPCPPKGGWEKVHSSQIFEAKVRTLDRHGESIDIPGEKLAEIVEIVRRSLIRCASLLNEIDTVWWRPPTLHPTGERGESFYGRKTLYFLWFKELFLRLVEIDPIAAKAETKKWPLEDIFFFGKFGIFAAMFPALASGSEAETIISGLSDEVFWSRENQREVLFTLRARWNDFSVRQRRRIERKIVAGPQKWGDEKLSQHRRRRAADAASRLRWLELNGCALSPIAGNKLNALKKVDDRWSDAWAIAADDSLGPKGGMIERVTELRGLDQLPIGEILVSAIERTERSIGELRDYQPFEGLVAAYPFRALSALRLARKNGEFHTQFWRDLLSDWPTETPLKLRWFAAETFSRLGSEQALELRHYLPRWLEKNLPALASANRSRALCLFDAICAPYLVADASATRSSVGHTTIGGIVQDRSEVSISKAINSPVGILAECLWDFLPVKASTRRPMPKYVGSRLERLFGVPGDGGGHAVCVIAQRMGWLDYCYRDWTRRVMLPLFSLEHPKSEAAWHGLAVDHNWLKSDMLKALNSNFLGVISGQAPWTLDDSEYRRHIQRMVFLSRPTDGGAIVTFEQARGVLMVVEDAKRADAIWTLADVLEQDKKDKDWKGFVRPFIENAWPRQVRYRTEGASRSFSRLVECAGKYFPDAVKLLLDLDLLRPVPQLDMITYRLSNKKRKGDGEKDFATKFPKETLSLLDALIADDRAQRPYELGKVLEAIAEADPTLRQNKAWRRLQELTA